MKVFADSSALVKMYVNEVGSEQVIGLESVAISAISRVEVLSAFWRKSNSDQILDTDVDLIVRAFESDLFGRGVDGRALFAVPASQQILGLAASLVSVHQLKTLDSIQLASALAARGADPDCQTFACFDQKLSRAARAHGFQVISTS